MSLVSERSDDRQSDSIFMIKRESPVSTSSGAPGSQKTPIPTKFFIGSDQLSVRDPGCRPISRVPLRGHGATGHHRCRGSQAPRHAELPGDLPDWLSRCDVLAELQGHRESAGVTTNSVHCLATSEAAEGDEVHSGSRCNPASIAGTA